MKIKFSCCELEKKEMLQIIKSDDGRNQEAISLFKLLSHPTRLKILQLLIVESEICTNELTDLSDEPQPAITKQLTKLRKEGILTSRKVTFKVTGEGWEKEGKEDGKWTAYRLADDKKDLITYLLTPFIDDKFQRRIKAIKIPGAEVIVDLVKGCK
ncbi:MAG: ArsR/SmtB family transcription factor [Candidatus Odinarchaeota archaeon]